MSEPQLYHPNERWEVATLPDRENAITFAVAHFIALANRAIEERGLFSVALSGGSTPKEIYGRLAQPEIAKMVDWSAIWSWRSCSSLLKVWARRARQPRVRVQWRSETKPGKRLMSERAKVA